MTAGTASPTPGPGRVFPDGVPLDPQVARVRISTVESDNMLSGVLMAPSRYGAVGTSIPLPLHGLSFRTPVALDPPEQVTILQQRSIKRAGLLPALLAVASRYFDKDVFAECVADSGTTRFWTIWPGNGEPSINASVLEIAKYRTEYEVVLNDVFEPDRPALLAKFRVRRITDHVYVTVLVIPSEDRLREMMADSSNSPLQMTALLARIDRSQYKTPPQFDTLTQQLESAKRGPVTFTIRDAVSRPPTVIIDFRGNYIRRSTAAQQAGDASAPPPGLTPDSGSSSALLAGSGTPPSRQIGQSDTISSLHQQPPPAQHQPHYQVKALKPPPVPHPQQPSPQPLLPQPHTVFVNSNADAHAQPAPPASDPLPGTSAASRLKPALDASATAFAPSLDTSTPMLTPSEVLVFEHGKPLTVPDLVFKAPESATVEFKGRLYLSRDVVRVFQSESRGELFQAAGSVFLDYFRNLPWKRLSMIAKLVRTVGAMANLTPGQAPFADPLYSSIVIGVRDSSHHLSSGRSELAVGVPYGDIFDDSVLQNLLEFTLLHPPTVQVITHTLSHPVYTNRTPTFIELRVTPSAHLTLVRTRLLEPHGVPVNSAWRRHGSTNVQFATVPDVTALVDTLRYKVTLEHREADATADDAPTPRPADLALLSTPTQPSHELVSRQIRIEREANALLQEQLSRTREENVFLRDQVADLSVRLAEALASAPSTLPREQQPGDASVAGGEPSRPLLLPADRMHDKGRCVRGPFGSVTDYNMSHAYHDAGSEPTRVVLKSYELLVRPPVQQAFWDDVKHEALAASTNEELLRKFLPNVWAELRALVHLDAHPNVATVFGAVLRVHRDRLQLQLVSEFNDTDLDTWAESSPSVSERLQAAQQIALGLEHLHAAGLYADPKPSNVLVSADGKQFRLCDYGLAETRALAKLHRAVQTAYLAPERAVAPPSAAADVYAFVSLVHFVLLPGQRLPAVFSPGLEVEQRRRCTLAAVRTALFEPMPATHSPSVTT